MGHVATCPPRADPQSSHYPPDQRGASSELQSGFQMDIDRASDTLLSVSVHGDTNKGKITQLADLSMDELIKNAEDAQPLWLLDLDGETEILNSVEFNRNFGPPVTTSNEILKMIKVDDPLALGLSDLGKSCYECEVCDFGGDLLSCDNCPRTYRPQCLDPPLECVPSVDWKCPECKKKDYPFKPEASSPADDQGKPREGSRAGTGHKGKAREGSWAGMGHKIYRCRLQPYRPSIGEK